MLKKAFFILLLLMIFALSATAISSPIKVGAPFPKLALNDIDGKEFIFESNNNSTIVLFFASWSEVCQKELQMFKDLKLKGIDVIAVSFDSDNKALKEFVADNKLPFKFLHDTKLVSPQRYQILVIPTTYIINSDGTIKNIFVDFDKNVEKSLTTSINSLLKK